MKEYASADIRNFAIVGHATCGKTMLAEAMLACGGVIGRLGSIANGTTVSDYHESEQKRKTSIHASLLHTEWLGKKLNIIDTPGYMDFISEALGALRVCDFATVVVHPVDGVGLGTQQVWKYATQFNIPKVLVINMLDKEHTDFDAVLGQLRERFGAKVFPLTLPMNAGPGFNQVLDVMRSAVMTYATDGSGRHTEAPATGEWLERVQALHQALIEAVAEADDALLERFFAGGGLSEEELRSGLHAAFQKGQIIPLFATASETNIGVGRLMDFVAKYGSSPLDQPRCAAENANGEAVELELGGKEPVLFVFKTLSEAHIGEMSFFRVYSGTVRFGMDLLNASRSTNERVGQIFVLNGKNRQNVNQLQAGDIGATVKLKDTHTSDTLCASDLGVHLPRLMFPRPNIHAALKLKSKGEEDKIAQGLSALHEEDPTFVYEVDSELRQTVLSGQGELHLQVISERLKSRYKVDFDLIAPRIRFRETIKGKAESKYRHKKQTGGAGQFAEVWMRIEPRPRGTGVEFTQTLTGQNVDRVFVPSVEKGVNAACSEGILAGYRVTDVKVDFYDGKMHPVDSKDIAFQIAGKEAFREAFLGARPCLLEPIHVVEIRVPDDAMGNVIGDLSSRRGKILGMDSADGFQVIRAQVPAMELYQYSTVLRSLTGGRAAHTEEFDHYEEMPKELEQKVIADSKKAKEEQQAS
ncbi:MAG TPA: elongation factor G [Verrucomicrobiota bacterium]|nr:elongation factor G [Verrucomicrobiota bacterium]HNU50098.1 elongation factor G [Verrucomicrobiota bacterium]